MNLEELKKSISSLDEILEKKSGDTINLNTKTCNSAQSRILKHYSKNIMMCSVIAVVFITLWLCGIDDPAFPVAMKGFLGIYMGLSAFIYALLYHLIKRINIVADTPMYVIRRVSAIRLFTLIAEIFLAIILVIFFTLFLSNLWNLGLYNFWFVAGALFVGVIIGVVMLPKKIKDFRELTDME